MILPIKQDLERVCFMCSRYRLGLGVSVKAVYWKLFFIGLYCALVNERYIVKIWRTNEQMN